MKRMIVASTSTLYGGGYLEYLMPELNSLFEAKKKLVFIPYARPGGISYDEYTGRVKEALKDLSLEVTGVHEYSDAREGISNAGALFVGGGNTFVLMDQLCKESLLPIIREKVLSGTPYLGTSAGSNITGPTVMTTNDMPIVHPPTLMSLNLQPFNINPHYLDPEPGSMHQGETRETRIKEFHTCNNETVLGLREGSWLEVTDQKILLKGSLSCRVFKQGCAPYEIDSGTDLTTEI